MKSKNVTVKRMCIDNPSTKQLMHHYHGQNVIAVVTEGELNCTIYFTKGKVVSCECPIYLLTNGWF